MKTPNLFIVGAAKSGTTSLYQYLRAHPQVFMSPIKEPNHFWTDSPLPFTSDYKEVLGRGSDTPVYIATWGQYLTLFSEVRDEVVIGEASVSYLWSRCAARTIRRELPDARIVIILRDPAERAYSQYLNDVRAGLRRGSFIKELGEERPNAFTWGMRKYLVEGGMYFEQVRRYLATFPRERVGVFLFDDLCSDAKGLMREVYGFVEVDADYLPANVGERVNACVSVPRWARIDGFLQKRMVRRAFGAFTGLGVRKRMGRLYYSERPPGLSGKEREMLVKIYREDVLRLQDLIGRDLSAWLRVEGSGW